MKAAVFYEPGGPEKIQLGEVPNPQIDHDQVLIQVKACSLNHLCFVKPIQTILHFPSGEAGKSLELCLRLENPLINSSPGIESL